MQRLFARQCSAERSFTGAAVRRSGTFGRALGRICRGRPLARRERRAVEISFSRENDVNETNWNAYEYSIMTL
jgi:hypothetical protein